MNNTDWRNKLRQKAQSRSIDLPAENKIVFSGDEQCLMITLRKAALTQGNMQDNDSAFEAWTLALMAGCEIAQVNIDCEIPDVEARNASRHYQRALSSNRT
jgi:hypothetical protein